MEVQPLSETRMDRGHGGRKVTQSPTDMLLQFVGRVRRKVALCGDAGTMPYVPCFRFMNKLLNPAALRLTLPGYCRYLFIIPSTLVKPGSVCGSGVVVGRKRRVRYLCFRTSFSPSRRGKLVRF